MASTGVRRVLRPVLYLGLAGLTHALLFLIPGVEGNKGGTGRLRGVRIKASVGGGEGERAGTGGKAAGPVETRRKAPTNPATAPVVGNPVYSSFGGGTAGKDQETAGTILGSGDRYGEYGSSEGVGGRSPGDTEFGTYVKRLKSGSVQEWATESANRNRETWKSSGKVEERVAAASNKDASGESGKSGKAYLDPRVKMVVTSYPPTGIERRYSQVPYPDLKIRKHEITSGWWNVYIQIVTDWDGRVVRRSVVRPETDGPVERLFVAQVQKEIDHWRFDPVAAEILVDVRFHVE